MTASTAADPAEELLYVACLHEGTGVEQPDFLAVVDASDGRVVHETPMPNVGDELHQFGWNRSGAGRSHLIAPGLRSSRIHIVNVADSPRQPRIQKVIEPEELVRKTGYTRPRTVRCLPDGTVAISMLGDAEGNGAGGFALLDADTFELRGRWDEGGSGPLLNCDFAYHAGANALVSSEFGEPSAYEPGFDLADVQAGRYGRRLHFWDLAARTLVQTVDLGERGLVPLGVRGLHRPDATEGFAGAALSGTLWHWCRGGSGWAAEAVVAIEPIEHDGWPFPVPALLTDLVIAKDDRFLYASSWLHGDVRQYDITEPGRPRLTGQAWLGGVLGHPNDADRPLSGGPQTLQLSLDGRRLYVSNSLYSTWDDQFYPGLRSWLLRLRCHPDGGLSVDPEFFVDLSTRRAGPARAHGMRLDTGDCTDDLPLPADHVVSAMVGGVGRDKPHDRWMGRR